MGRTGTMFACAQEGIAPDIAVIAKGLGGGYQPIGAMLASGKIYEAIAHGSGTFMHGHTYMGHPMACAAGLAVLDTIREERLLDNVKAMGARLRERLGARFGNHPQVGDVRGRGLFQAIEIVADRATKRPIDAARQIHARIKSEAMARGLMVYPMGGTIDGRSGDHVLVAPPYIVTATEIDTIVERLGDAVDAALGTTN
jgi:adenosylmethionine-8-amino-7-oxononanoate aminotransferase